MGNLPSAKLVLIPAAAEHPLRRARRARRGSRARRAGAVGGASCSRADRSAAAAKPELDQVRVRVGERRHHGAAAQLDDARLGADERVDVVERDDDVAAHGDGAGVRARRILGEDVAAAQYEVGRSRRLGGDGGGGDDSDERDQGERAHGGRLAQRARQMNRHRIAEQIEAAVERDRRRARLDRAQDAGAGADEVDVRGELQRQRRAEPTVVGGVDGREQRHALERQRVLNEPSGSGKGLTLCTSSGTDNVAPAMLRLLTFAGPSDSVGSCGTGSVPDVVTGTVSTPSGVPKPICVCTVYVSWRLMNSVCIDSRAR